MGDGSMTMRPTLSATLFVEDEDDFDRTDIPGISELRNQGTQYSDCHVWEVEEPPNIQEVYRTRRRHCSGVIRFGSTIDCMVHSVTRVLVLVDLMLVPFVISFEYVYPLHACVPVHMFDGLTTLLYTVCVLQAFWTSYIDPKEMVEVKDPLKIQLHVLCSYGFVLDIMSIFSAPALYTHTHIRWFAVLRLTKCRRLMQDKTRVMLLDDVTALLPKLAQIMLLVYGCAHLYACVWFKAKVLSARGYGHEWTAWNGWSQDVFDKEHVNLDSYSLPIEPGDLNDLLICYCRALRDGCFMVVTWGSPNALSFWELGILIILGPLLSCIMAYVFGYIVTIIGNYTTMQDRLAKQMHVLNAACLDMRVQTSLRLRICRYHSYKQAHHMDIDAQTLFDELSPNLVSETRVYRMRHMILSADVFQGLTPRLILILLSTATEHLFSPGDLIVRRGEIADCMYIVMTGILSVLVGANAEIVVKKLHDNQMFGEACFLSDNEPRMAFVRAETFAVLSRFDRDSFDHVMMGHQDLKEDIKEAILRTIGKYKAPGAAPSPESATKSGSDMASRNLSRLSEHSALSLHDPTSSAAITELYEIMGIEKEGKKNSHGSLPLNGVLQKSQTDNMVMGKTRSDAHHNHHRSSLLGAPSRNRGSVLASLAEPDKVKELPVTNGNHCEDSDDEVSDTPLQMDMVHATMSMNVISTTGFRASSGPRERKSEKRSSSLKPQVQEPTSMAPELAPEKLSVQLRTLSLQGEAQLAAVQSLSKFSIGRSLQREAVTFLKDQAATLASEFRPVLARECQALLGQLMCLELAQKRLDGMINVPPHA